LASGSQPPQQLYIRIEADQCKIKNAKLKIEDWEKEWGIRGKAREFSETLREGLRRQARGNRPGS
jgi:hypothetical protein